MCGSNLLDDVFAILTVATKLEENEDTRIEAATKVCVNIDHSFMSLYFSHKWFGNYH